MAERRIIRGMTNILKKTGHACPKAARSFCHDILHIYWKPGQPAFDEAVFDERMRAYNEGTLDKLLRKNKKR